MAGFQHEKEVSLPSGYEPVDVGRITENPELRARIRQLHGKFYYLFNAKDAGFLEYLAKCKEDTKELAKALQQELDGRGIAVWARGDHASGSRRKNPKMNFFIRPPFLKSFVSDWEKAHKRMKKDDRCDNFVLHLDPQHRLQMVRHMGAEIDSSRMMEINNRRTQLGGTLEIYLQDMESMYGQWERIAQKMADAIEKPLTYAELRNLMNSSPPSASPPPTEGEATE